MPSRLTTAEAITDTTAFADPVCGLADRTGTVEISKDADILAVARSPLEDIAAHHDIVAVHARARVATAPSHTYPGSAAPVAFEGTHR